MSLTNIKRHIQAVRQNNGILDTDQVQLETETSTPADSDLAVGRIYCDGSTIYGYNGTSFVDMMATSTINISAWETLYAADTQLDVTGAAVTFAGTHASNNTFALSASGTGDCLAISNTGSGFDISGTSDEWSIKSSSNLGVLELGTGGTINAGDGDLELSVASSTTTIQGDILVDETSIFTGAVTATASITITGSANTDVFTITDGDIVVTSGSITMTDADEAATLTIVNQTAAAVHVIDVNADAITNSGVMLHLDTLAAGMGTGKFIECHDGANAVFSVALYGATTIAGNAGSTVLTITAGDASMADGSLTIADDDDATTLSVTNDAAIGTNSAFVLIDTNGTYVGSTTKSVVYIVPSGLTQGTGLYMATSTITSGKFIHLAQAGEALTSGEMLNITNAEDGDLATKTGQLCLISSTMDETGAANVTENYDVLSIARNDELNHATPTYTAQGSILKLKHISAQTQGTMTNSVIGLEVELSGATALGHAVQVTNVGATGSAVNVVSANIGADDVLITGSGAHTNGFAGLHITTSGNLATGGANLILTVSGASCDAAARAFEIDAQKNVQAVYIDSDATTNDAIYVTHSGNLGAGKAVMHIVDLGDPQQDGSYVLHVAKTTLNANETSIIFADGGGMDATGLYVDCDCVDSAGNLSAQVALYSDAAGNLPVLMQFYHSDAGAGDGEIQARLNFYGSNDGTPAKNLYAKIEVASDDVSTDSEDGSVTISADLASTITTSAIFTGNQVALGAAAATLTTAGTWDLTLSTNGGTNSGTIVITDNVNQNITITPNGTGAVDLAGKLLHSETTASTGAGAVAITGTIHEITTNATGNAMSLANGTEGQVLHIVYVAEGAGADTAILSPTSFNDTSITFTDLGESVTLLYTAASWYVVGNGGTTIA